MIKVSVIIPTYNYAYLIDQAIKSILSQTYENLELIITDDCSEDNTEEVVARFPDPRIRFYRNEKRLGLYGNFNNARKYARGEYLLFLCADDALDRYAIEEMVTALENHPSAAIATAYRKQGIDIHGRTIGGIQEKKLGPGLVRGEDVILAQCRYAGSVGRPSEVLIRASCLDNGDTFDRSVEHCADNDLWCKLCEKWDVYYVENALAYIRHHKGQATYYHEKILLDIQSDCFMFNRLFNKSIYLKHRKWMKHIFIKNRCFPWFQRSLKEAVKGNMKRSFWIIGRILTFSKEPWWIPYFIFCEYKIIFIKSISYARNNLLPRRQ